MTAICVKVIVGVLIISQISSSHPTKSEAGNLSNNVKFVEKMHLESNDDIEIQNQITELVAQYLSETGDSDALTSLRYLEDTLPSEFGRERVRDRNRPHHHDRHRNKNPAVAAAAAAIPVKATDTADPVAAVAAIAASNNEAARVDAGQSQNQTAQRETVVAPAPIIPVIIGTPTAQAPAPVAAAQAPAPVVTTAVPVTLPPRSTVDPVHHLNQVNKILGNVANGNIVGIVDESLAIRAPPPVRNLVTNILKVVFCNPIDRIFRRCAPNQVDAAANSATGK